MSAADMTPELFVENMLRHVPFDGWSDRGIRTTAEELGLSASDVARLFPKGVASVVAIGSDDVDAKMVAKFRDFFSGRFDGMPVHIRIRELLLIRFEILQPHKEAVRKMSHLLWQSLNMPSLAAACSTRRLTGFGEPLVTALLILIFTPNAQLWGRYMAQQCWPFWMITPLICKKHAPFWTGVCKMSPKFQK